MSDDLKELSILIVTWNGDDLLKDCLDSLKRACGDVPEIVIVDNANLASTKALVAAYPNAAYIAAPENLGFAGGNNLGLPLCTRPYVLLLNNDTIVHEEPFTLLIQYLKEHPKVAVVQGTMNLPRLGNVLDMCGALITPCGILRERYARQSTLKTIRKNRPVLVAKGAMLLFDKTVIALLGGELFHQSFINNYEESDFCHRVWVAGREVHFVDTPPIDHLMGATISKIKQTNIFAQSLSNNLYSLLSILEPRWLFSILVKFFGIQLLICCNAIIKCRLGDIAVVANGIQKIYARRMEILSVRKTIRKSRSVSDADIFNRVMIHPPLRFYWKLLRGQIGEYVDE